MSTILAAFSINTVRTHQVLHRFLCIFTMRQTRPARANVLPPVNATISLCCFSCFFLQRIEFSLNLIVFLIKKQALWHFYDKNQEARWAAVQSSVSLNLQFFNSGIEQSNYTRQCIQQSRLYKNEKQKFLISIR